MWKFLRGGALSEERFRGIGRKLSVCKEPFLLEPGAHLEDVLVAASGEIHDELLLLFGILAGELQCIGKRMCALKRRDDALAARELNKGRKRFAVGGAPFP